MMRFRLWILMLASGLFVSLASPSFTAVGADGILLNASFEEGANPSNPSDWLRGAGVPGVEYLWDKSIGYQSRASVVLDKTANNYFPIAQWHQTVDRPSGAAALQLSAQVRAQKVTKAIVDVTFYGENSNRLGHEWVIYVGAKEAGDAPATHHWKKYTGEVGIPAGTKKMQIALQIYGPGKVWFDDIQATSVEGKGEVGHPIDPPQIKIESKKLQAENDPNKTYFLIRSPNAAPPENGYKLLLVMPGGDGSADFNPFVQRIHQNALPEGYLVAQLVAPQWTADQVIVWPHMRSKVAGMKFTTEQFVESVIADVKKRHVLNGKHVFTFTWSSSGPAAYAESLRLQKSTTGSFISMSVFKEDFLPPLSSAKGRAYYIEHSPEDKVCPYGMARNAYIKLAKNGAKVKFSTYKGGHGWQGDVWGRIRKGVEWLEDATQ